jgi:hypothetical protein
MGHVGEIGRGARGGGGEATRIGPAPTAEGPREGRGRTGERPALDSHSEKTQTHARVPATFADALTPEQGTRGKAVTATLIMPQVPVPPARGGQDVLPSGSPQQAPQGPPVSPMDTPIGRGGGTRIVRMPEAPGGKERPAGPSRGGDTQPGTRTQTRDGFGATPTTGNRPALGQGEARGRVLPVKDLVPKGLEKLLSQEGVAKRFASDLALLHQQLRPSEMPSSERALRAWAFFTAYAEAAAAHETTPEGRETFDKALKDQGFAELRDAHTGDDGMAAAQWVLESSNPEEARARAEQVQPEPPPEVRLSESAQPEAPRKPQPKDAPPQAPSQEHRDHTFTQGPERPALERASGQAEFVRISPQLAHVPPPVMVPLRPDAGREAREAGDETPLDRWTGRAKRLGRNMLWNVLHRFRAGPEDSAIEKEKWDQIAFGAVLAIAGMMVLIILLVAL